MTATRYTMADIRSANKAAGHHWFDPSSMRFFNTIVSRSVYQGPGGVFFVSSEQFVGSQGADPRKYTVRTFDPANGHVGTLGEFNVIRTIDEARSIAKAAARGI